MLGPSEIVFEKRQPRGTRPGDYFAHIYALDVTTRAERLLTNLDDDDTKTGIVYGLSVSPDRRKIAFGSKTFRTTPDDNKFGFSSGILWTVSANGREFQRITPSYDSQIRDAGSCTRDADCAELYSCQMSRCVRASFSMSFGSPVFAADGSRIFFREAWSWIDERGGTINAVLAQSWLRIADGARPVDSGLPSCKAQQPLARHPVSGSLLVFRATCAGPTTDPSWFTEWTEGGTHRPLHRDDTGRIPITPESQPFAAWLPDGSGFYYISLGERNATGNPRSSKQGLSLWTSGASTANSIYPPGTNGGDVDGVTVLGTGAVVVELARLEGGSDRHDLYLVDPATGQAAMKLTDSGNNHDPAW
jgi:hypothetical protein